MQVRKLADLPVEERAALALISGGLADVPHVVVDDQLPTTLEYVKQRNGAMLAGHRDRRVHLDHRQPPASRRDGVSLPGVRLLADEQPVQLRLPVGPGGDWRVLRLIGHARLHGCPLTQ